MTQMIYDVDVTKDDWVNAHALTKISPGLALTFQVKGDHAILAKLSDTKPKLGIPSGYRLISNEMWASDLGDTVWLKAENGTSAVHIQEK